MTKPVGISDKTYNRISRLKNSGKIKSIKGFVDSTLANELDKIPLPLPVEIETAGDNKLVIRIEVSYGT